MKTYFKKLQEKAKKLGLNLGSSGGYYLLSGYIRGKHRQGRFTNLHSVKRQLEDESKFV